MEGKVTISPVNRVLVAVASELDKTDTYLQRLEDVLVALIQTSQVEISSEQKSTLQEIDLLSQTLKGLSVYLRDVSQEIPSGTSIDTSRAISGLTLAAMKKRLDCSAEQARRTPSTSGTVDMF